MKKLFKILALMLVLASVLSVFCACGMSKGDFMPGIGAAGAGYDKFEGELAGGEDFIPSETPEGGSYDEGSDSTNSVTAGLLTASAHNDNDYYLLWKSLFEKGQTDSENAKFSGYTGNKIWGTDTLNRVKVTVTSNGKPVVGAKVVFSGENQSVIYTAVSDSNGVAYVFGNTDGGYISASCVCDDNAVTTASVKVEYSDTETVIELSQAGEKAAVVDVMFMIDATGSMGDELRYIENELEDVVNSLVESLPNVRINLAILIYRDTCDDEMLKYSDFKDVTDKKNLSAQKKFLKNQQATGGGDYPEAVDEALQEAISKNWSENSTKILFHVLDAPPHNGEEYRTRYNAAALKAAEYGIRVCPILASGGDTFTEYVIRQTAVMTGGTFVFLTDDSGIGNSHHDPEIPNVVVEKLNKLMVRLVKGYYTGVFDAPVSVVNSKTYYIIRYSDKDEDFIFSGAKTAYLAGSTVTIYTDIVMNADVELWVDGEFACKAESYYDETLERYFNKFTFTMPENNVFISFKYTVGEDVPE